MLKPFKLDLHIYIMKGKASYWPGLQDFFPSTKRTICQRDLLMVPCEYSVLRDMPTCERTENKNTKCLKLIIPALTWNNILQLHKSYQVTYLILSSNFVYYFDQYDYWKHECCFFLSLKSFIFILFISQCKEHFICWLCCF
jgi:hypothetical protein